MTVAVEAGRHIAAAVLDTFYLDSGEGSPIVLIHGGGAGANSWGNWQGVIPRLTPHHRVVAIDMLGFGDTAKPNGDFVYSQRARTNHLIAALDALDLGPAVLVGNSMGGAPALGVAVDRPDLVRRPVRLGRDRKGAGWGKGG